MKRTICILTAAVLSAMLAACEYSTYIPVDENYSVLDSAIAAQMQKKANPLETKITDYSYDKRYEMNAAPFTFDDKYMYCLMPMGFAGDQIDDQRFQRYKLDLQTGETKPMCDVPGCTHDVNTFPDCINNSLGNVQGFTAVGNDFWCLDSDKDEMIYNSIAQRTSGGKSRLFENTTFCTDFEEELHKLSPKEKYSISDFFVRDDLIYVVGESYVYRIDRRSMKARDLIDVCDSRITGGMLYGEKMYLSDDLGEVFVADFESGSVKKIADKMYSPRVYDDVLYLYDIENKAICKAGLDGRNITPLIENCQDKMLVKGGKMFYLKDDAKSSLISYDLESGEETVIFDEWNSGLFIGTADHIDRIFALGTDSEGNSIILSVRADGSGFWSNTLNGFDNAG